MALTPEHKARISASIKARYESDPSYRERVGQASRGATAAHYARIREENAELRDQLQRLQAENAALREAITRLEGGDR